MKALKEFKFIGATGVHCVTISRSQSDSDPLYTLTITAPKGTTQQSFSNESIARGLFAGVIKGILSREDVELPQDYDPD